MEGERGAASGAGADVLVFGATSLIGRFLPAHLPGATGRPVLDAHLRQAPLRLPPPPW